MSESEEHLFTLEGNEDEVVISKMNRLKIRFANLFGIIGFIL